MDDTDSGSGFSASDIEASLDRLRQQREAQDAEAAQQQAALMRSTSARPQSGGVGAFLNSTGGSMMSAGSMMPSSAGAATSAGTGQGATGLYGIGGTAQMAGGESGSSLFALGGEGSAAGGGTSTAGASSGVGGSIAAAGPWAALAAAVLAHNKWATNKDMHTNSDAIMGRALYKDADWYQPRLNDKVDGLGDEVKFGSLGSSPIDLFRGKTWSDAAKYGLSGGILGAAIKKLF